ncbi:MAG TPA: hypothetical protein VLH09_02735 [Bryobacteraceae bacterium]|nr:hypothetical protein [Bryobacteraceae bacterium]
MKRMKTNPAFTLIEVLAATALAGLLMLAILSVIASLGRSSAALPDQAAPARTAALLELLRWDLVHARRIHTQKDEFILEGFGALDRQGRSPEHRPVRVTYRLQAAGQRQWLIRRQTGPADQRGQAGSWSELLHPDVVALDLQLLPEKAGAGAGTEGIRPANGLIEVPSAVRLVIRGPMAEVPLVDQVIVLR